MAAEAARTVVGAWPVPSSSPFATSVQLTIQAVVDLVGWGLRSVARSHRPSYSSFSSTLPMLPWFPVLAADEDNNHQLLRDVAASAPSPTLATTTTATPNHHHLRPTRRVAKHHPRPPRKLPTTYMIVEPVSFHR